MTVVSLVLGSPFLLWVVVGPSVMLYSSHDDTYGCLADIIGR